MRVVVDASAAVEFLLRTRIGHALDSFFDGADLFAPELLDAEVMAVIRREALARRLDAERANEAIDDLTSWPVERIAHRRLIEMAWSLRHNLTAYDAMYVAAAHALSGVVVTADGPLSRVPNAGVVIHNVRA